MENIPRRLPLHARTTRTANVNVSVKRAREYTRRTFTSLIHSEIVKDTLGNDTFGVRSILGYPPISKCFSHSYVIFLTVIKSEYLRSPIFSINVSRDISILSESSISNISFLFPRIGILVSALDFLLLNLSRISHVRRKLLQNYA